jgi:hypothetical protein
VFPALRDNELHFYSNGARLCRYTDKTGFAWHEWTEGIHCIDAYTNLKDGINRNYSESKSGTKERAVLAKLYKRFSPYSYARIGDAAILLDIEVGFPSTGKRDASGERVRDNTQIDLLFLNNKTGQLVFIEGKAASDRRIKAARKDKETRLAWYERLEISKQLEKYEQNLENNKNEIMASYKNTIKVMSEIFTLNLILHEPKEICPRPKLLVYGSPTQNGKVCLDAIKKEIGNGCIYCEEVTSLSPEQIFGANT